MFDFIYLGMIDLSDALGIAALFVSLLAMVTSVVLPLYLAKRSEIFSMLEKDKGRLPPFYRKIKEFAIGVNTPGVGFHPHELYYLSNEAAEYAEDEIKDILLRMLHNIELKSNLNPNKENDEMKIKDLGVNFQRDLQLLHDLAELKSSLVLGRK